MHYNARGFSIRSEDAARPGSQASSYVIRLLEDLGPFGHALDYGCGKLRYSQYLYHLCRRLTLVDSREQVDRRQMLLGCTSTIREYVDTKWYASRVLTVSQFEWDQRRYEFILCANVLSAIPDCETRIGVLQSLAQRLQNIGRCLIACQYTNSYFCNRMRDPHTVKYNDGFIVGAKENASFYGLIKLDRMLEYVSASGLAIEEAWRHDQSAYVLAKVDVT